ncbi:hypothetical protein [Salarchaeum japonicum]|uniref:hypothetical protein n=1 Tax=Salarchaeum japonicum TaxID=555573 RepID=UPI003C77C500
MNKKYIFVVLAATILTMGFQGPQVPIQTNTETFDSITGAEYTVSFDEKTKILQLTVENPTERTLNTTYSFDVDGWEYSRDSLSLQPGATHYREYNITDGIHVEQNNHSVHLLTAGGSAQFDFSGEYSTLSSGGVPTPKITNITIDTGTARGNESTVVYVTVKNPSENVYVSHVVAHTQETSATSSMANPLPGTSETVKLELLEPVGSDVRGEIRLFMGKPNETEGALAQVEFSGSAASETEYARETYEPFSLDGPNGGYSYSSGAESGSVPAGVQWIVAGGLGLVLIGSVLWWRR